MNIQEKQKKSLQFSPNNAGSAFLISFIFYIGFSIIASSFFADFLTANNFWVSVINVVLSEVVFVVTFLVLCKTTNAHKKIEPIIKKNANFKCYLISGVVIIVLIFCMLMFNDVFKKLMEMIGYKDTSQGVVTSNIWQLVGAVLIFGIIPAICEETIFRGVIYNGLRHIGTVKAVVLTSAFFIFFHGGLYQTFFQVILTTVFIIALNKTGDLKLSMFMHFVNNAAVLILNFFLPAYTVSLSWWFILIALLLFGVAIASIYIYNKILGKISDTKFEEPVSTKPETLSLNGEEVFDETKVADKGNAIVLIATIVGAVYYVVLVVFGFLT